MSQRMRSTPTHPRILAISSGGGHWVELLRIMPAFDGCDVVYSTVSRAYASDVPGERFMPIHDATRWNRIRLLLLAVRILWLLLRLRPHIVVTTGAAPGYLALRLARLIRARTIWLDSIANVDELSMSGALAGRHASLWLTQWPHLAKPNGPHYRGAVL